MTYETPDGCVVSHRVGGAGGAATGTFDDAAADVRTEHQVYFWEPDTYSDEYVLPK